MNIYRKAILLNKLQDELELKFDTSDSNAMKEKIWDYIVNFVKEHGEI